jgi:uncharacterized protein YjbJ (UPF0337 family)
VSIIQKIRHKAESAKGAAKKGTGRVTRNRRLRTRGRIEKTTGDARQAVDKVKDALKH